MSLNQGEAGTFAKILTESLPYIQRFTGKTFVIKFGGNAMTDPTLHESFARDVVLMKLVNEPCGCAWRRPTNWPAAGQARYRDALHQWDACDR